MEKKTTDRWSAKAAFHGHAHAIQGCWMLLQLIVGLAAIGAYDTHNDDVLRVCLAVSLVFTLGALVLVFAAWVHHSRKLEEYDPGPWPGRNFGDCSPPTAQELAAWRAEGHELDPRKWPRLKDIPNTALAGIVRFVDAAGCSLAQTRMQGINDELLHISGPACAQEYVDALDGGTICGMFRDAIRDATVERRPQVTLAKRNFYDLMSQVWACEENTSGNKRHLCGVYSQWTWGEVRERTANL